MTDSGTMRDDSSGGTVSAHLARFVACVSADATLREVAHKLMATETGALVVGSTDQVDGIISERDVVSAVGLGRDLDAVKAGDVAATELIWCDPTRTMGEVGQLMADNRVRHVLVRDEGRLAGIVSARDVLVAVTGSPGSGTVS